jgi:hypothetical protein
MTISDEPEKSNNMEGSDCALIHMLGVNGKNIKTFSQKSWSSTRLFSQNNLTDDQHFNFRRNIDFYLLQFLLIKYVADFKF